MKDETFDRMYDCWLSGLFVLVVLITWPVMLLGWIYGRLGGKR